MRSISRATLTILACAVLKVATARAVDLTLGNGPTANVVVNGSTFTADADPASLAVADVRQAQAAFASVTVSASGNMFSSVTGPFDLSASLLSLTQGSTRLAAGGAFTAAGADNIVTNGASAAFPQNSVLSAGGAIAIHSLNATLMSSQALVSASSGASINLTGTTIDVPGGISAGIDTAVTGSRLTTVPNVNAPPAVSISGLNDGVPGIMIFPNVR